MKESLNSLYATLLQPDAKTLPVIRNETRLQEPIGVVDGSTFQSIEVDKLFDSVNCAETHLGQATLYRSLQQPLTDIAVLHSKQDAIREIEANPALHQQLQGIVSRAKQREKDFFELLFGTFMGLFSSKAHELELEGYGYTSYINGTGFMLELVEGVNQVPAASSGYLTAVLENIRDLAKSRSYALAKGPAYRAEKGMITREEKGWFTPAILFRPALFKPLGLTLFVIILFLVVEFVPLLLDMVASVASAFWLFLLPLALMYIPIVGNFDRDGCIYPLREIFKGSPEVARALDALGQLDELLGLIRFKHIFGHPACLPTLVDAPRHSLRVTAVRNPILARNNPAYVGNDIDLGDARLTLITGPNSGGKTAFCKTLAQTQLLAQIGAYVPAREAELTVADRIFYQAPEISHLTDGEGRFGTELRRTKAIFLAATPRSLVIMDELSEGTTHEEKIEISMNILDGFYQKGNNTLLITHNHELVDRYQQKGIGMARQVEFKDEQPTYRVIEGISRVSHAERVARKIGFSREDIARYLSDEIKD
ncbi:MAG: DNA mismatch repair protein MutS [Methylococcaceae bacterium]|nr:DNA mismatch repair protein MutS [Methylococcaceae bacterium]